MHRAILHSFIKLYDHIRDKRRAAVERNGHADVNIFADSKQQKSCWTTKKRDWYNHVETPAAADLKAGVREKAAFLYIHGHFTFGKGMPHTFAMDYALYPEAENAMNEILTFINNVLDLR